jgi:tetratricopeptide (TPR) repeat protein
MLLVLRLIARVRLQFLHALGSVLGWTIYGMSPTYRRHLRENLAAAGYDDSRVRSGAIAAAGKMIMELPALWFRPHGEVVALVKSVDALPADKQLAALTKAVELAPGNRLAWERVADQARTAKLPAAQQKQVDELYRRVLLRRVPEYALAWRMRMIKDRPAPERVAALKKMGDEFRSSPALFSMARVALGDAWADEKRRDEALAAYEEALARSPNSGPIAVLVMERIDPLMHKTNELERLAEIYSKAFGMSERIRASAWARTTPFYMLGDRYAQVLQELNDESRAQGVRAQLDNVVQLGQGPGQKGR